MSERVQGLLATFVAITEAERRGDVDEVARHVADDFRGADPGGEPQDREKMLAGHRRADVRVESLDTSELETRIVGEVGLVTGRLRIGGRAAGERFELRLRFLDVFAWRDGRWWLIASHGTPIPVPQLEP
jgi:ketosteroid isomerase-like protein